jgi:predicted nucleotidyltransferase
MRPAAMLDLIEQNRGQIAALCGQYRVRKLELIGSAARGDFDPKSSDVDFWLSLRIWDGKVHSDVTWGSKWIWRKS